MLYRDKDIVRKRIHRYSILALPVFIPGIIIVTLTYVLLLFAREYLKMFLISGFVLPYLLFLFYWYKRINYLTPYEIDKVDNRVKVTTLRKTYEFKLDSEMRIDKKFYDKKWIVTDNGKIYRFILIDDYISKEVIYNESFLLELNSINES